MKRKVVRHGSSSLTITLPNKWAEKFHIEKGDDVNVEEEGASLLVTTMKESSPRKKVLTAAEGIFTKNNLSHLYQLGYDEIEIEFAGQQVLKEIKERLPNCMGFEIVDQKANRIYIKSIAATIESEFDNLLRKAFMITEGMASELIEALENNDYSKLPEIRNLESLNNKFTDICIRILNKRGYHDPQRTMQMYEIVKNIERVADELKYLCDFLHQTKKIDKTVMAALKQAHGYYRLFYELFYKATPEIKSQAYIKGKHLLLHGKEMLKKSKGAEALALHYICNMIQKTYDGVGGYFALTL